MNMTLHTILSIMFLYVSGLMAFYLFFTVLGERVAISCTYDTEVYDLPSPQKCLETPEVWGAVVFQALVIVWLVKKLVAWSREHEIREEGEQGGE